jgi:hypothetical protein
MFFSGPLQAGSRTCRIVFPERPQSAPKTAHLFDGRKSHPVDLPSMNFSEVIELPGGDLTLALTRDEIKDPKQLPPHLPILRIPEDVKDFYIVLLPDAKNKDMPVKMNLVSTGAGKLKPGETLWFNFTDHRIVAMLSTMKLDIQPHSKTVSKSSVIESGYYSAKLAYQANGAGPLAPITEQSWWHDIHSRHVGFIVETGGRLPRIYFFRDFRPPLPEGESIEIKPATKRP